MNDAVPEVVVDVAKAALTAGFGELTKVIAEEQLRGIVSNAVSQALGGVASEIAKAGVSGIAGLVLKVLLNVGDQTAAHVGKQIREPMITGLREAREALELQLLSPADTEVIRERLQNADARLAQAFSLAQGAKEAWRPQTYIALVRGLVAKSRQADGVAVSEFRRVMSILTPQLAALKKKETSELKLQEGNEIGMMRGFYGATNAYMATKERLANLRMRQIEINQLIAFVTRQVDDQFKSARPE